MKFLSVIAVLFMGPMLIAQQVNPPNLQFESVPPYTSPQENIAFSNTGLVSLTVSVSVDNPNFVIAENLCTSGVKPGTHCNVYLTYTAQTIGQIDNATLTFDYGNGVTAAPLVGNGVQWIETVAKLGPGPYNPLKVHVGDPVELRTKLWVLDKYYDLPIGQQASFRCEDGRSLAPGIFRYTGTFALCTEGCAYGPFAEIWISPIVPQREGFLTCTMKYDGDGILEPATASVTFTVGRPRPGGAD